MDGTYPPLWQTQFSTELQQQAATCQRCRQLYKDYQERFDKPGSGLHVSHRTPLDLALVCPLCEFIYSVSKREGINNPALRFEEVGSTQPLLDRVNDVETVSKVTWHGLSVKGSKACIAPILGIGSASANDGALSGRFLKSELDLNLLRSWTSLCESHHGAKCRSPPFDEIHAQAIKLRMVDLEQNCVVAAPPHCRYAALSYVWGEGDRLLLMSSTSGTLEKPGGLSGQHCSIPRTFSEAMILARQLGFTYLWIDALCIMQDDTVELGKQLSSMDRVYGCAALTIVSDASSIHVGIPGVRAQSRKPEQLQYRGQHIKLLALQNGPFSDLNLSPWSRRAWTFQEEVLSKSVLVLAHDQAYYLCRSAVYREDLVCESTELSVVPADLGSMKKAERWQFRQVEQDFDKDELFLHRLELFTKRNLTYKGDALNAFAGVIASLFPCHFGLPKHLFAEAILWTFKLRSTIGARNTNFPSWSWAGWNFGKTGVVGGSWFMPRHAFHYQEAPQTM